MGDETTGRSASEGRDQNQNIQSLLHELEEEKRRSAEYLTRLKYMQADFENFRKRVERQLEDVRRYSNERIVCDLLEVVDELEMALSAVQPTLDTLSQGVGMTLKKLKKILEKEGVCPIECRGKPFDPSRHSAVATIAGSGLADGSIVEEVRTGYLMNEKVIRPSIVKVAVNPPKGSEEKERSGEGRVEPEPEPEAKLKLREAKGEEEREGVEGEGEGGKLQ